MNCILPRTARKTVFGTLCLLSCLWMTAPTSYCIFWCGHSRERGGCSFSCCPFHLTIDHTSLSRRSTVPTPNRDTSNVRALSVFLRRVIQNVLLTLSPSSWAACGHHRSPKTAIVFSLPSINIMRTPSMSHASTFLVYSNTRNDLRRG